MKILACVMNYGTSQKQLCENVINRFNSIQGHDISVKVFSSEICGFQGCEEILVTKYQGVYFIDGIYDYLRENSLSEYTHVLMLENDLLFSQENFDTYAKYESAMPSGSTLGFMVKEEKDGEWYVIHPVLHKDASSFKEKFSIAEMSLDGKFVRFVNCHQSSWFLAVPQLKYFLANPPTPAEWLVIEGKTQERDFERNTAQFYFSEKFPGSRDGLRKWIPMADFEKMLVHHQPNKFIGMYNEVPTVKAIKEEWAQRYNRARDPEVTESFQQIESEFARLLEYAKGKKLIMEIGTAFGGTLKRFSEVLDNRAEVISVDLVTLPGYPSEEKLQGWMKDDQTLHIIRQDSRLPETIEKVRSILNGRKLDFLFIDGDHSYEGVKADYENYKQFVAGWIGFHDIQRTEKSTYGVTQFWNELSGEKYEFIQHEWQNSFGIGVICHGKEVLV